MHVREWNFDGLVGPTHHFGGLGVGNVASLEHEGRTAYPRSAALQGLEKIAAVAAAGVPQAVLPPHPRPDLAFLRSLGFAGSAAEVLEAAAASAPRALSAAWSASSMWTANAATVSPAADTRDGRMHLTVANLSSSLHRSLEPPETERIFREMFADPSSFAVHVPLPAAFALRDEGAANHMRLADRSEQRGIEIFVHGAASAAITRDVPNRFFSRQSRLASQSIARRHQLSADDTFYLTQHPDSVGAGAFHNDVVATSCQHLLIHHQLAFIDADQTLERIERRFHEKTGIALQRIEIESSELTLADAIDSYLFNSQIVVEKDADDLAMLMICPVQVCQLPAARQVVDRLVAGENPIRRVAYVDLRESMSNGGGPACLRLRVPLTKRQAAQVPPAIAWSDTLDEQLRRWVNNHYRDSLALSDLADPELAGESREALRELAGLLKLSTLAEAAARMEA